MRQALLDPKGPVATVRYWASWSLANGPRPNVGFLLTFDYRCMVVQGRSSAFDRYEGCAITASFRGSDESICHCSRIQLADNCNYRSFEDLPDPCATDLHAGSAHT